MILKPEDAVYWELDPREVESEASRKLVVTRLEGPGEKKV